MARQEPERGKDYYNNKNGYLSEKEMLDMVENDEVDNFIKHHTVTHDKCPHEMYLHRDEYKHCFFCKTCLKSAFSYFGYEIKDEKENE